MRNGIQFNAIRSPLWNWTVGDLDGLFDRAFEDFAGNSRRGRAPYEVQETDAGYFVTLDVPGVNKEDLKIEVVDQVLTISGERKRLNETEGRKFSWQFAIPASADSSKVEAKLESGVLQIALPKIELAQPRNIEIQSHDSGLFARLLGKKGEA